ncbi:competence pheromone ComX [Paenibacillus sp. HB172176]|uniref:competence pheromone ComX n=1 Tax=Paenibacillus sp. HB172176 TaxID=2493690 RepID=UPI00143A0DD3|nr:competence pheromone ComX [Paenibacillus sp. HB172176]
MLKETIRQLVGSTEKMSMAMGGQLQLSGISAAEQKALLGELKDKNEKKSGYAFMWD